MTSDERILVPGSQSELPAASRAGWGAALDRLEAMRDMMQKTASLIKGDGKTISPATRKRLLETSGTQLVTMSGELSTLSAQIEALHQWSLELRDHIRDSETSRVDIMKRLDTVASDMTRALSRLAAAEKARDVLQVDRDNLAEKVAGLENQLSNAQNLNTQLSADQRRIESRKNVEKQRTAELTRELQHLRESSRQAQEARRGAESVLSGVESARDKAVESVSRVQQSLARVAADNVVLIMQRKELERQASALECERDELKLAVEHQKGPWFDEIKSQVEDRVTKTMVRIHELEEELSQERAKRDMADNEWRTKLGALEGELAEAIERESELSGLVTSTQDQLKEAEKGKENASTQAVQSKQEADEARAEAKVLRNNVTQAREAERKAKQREDDAEKLKKKLEESLRVSESKLSKAEAELKSTKAKLNQQEKANKELLSRKAEIEWDLVCALSAGESGPEPSPLEEEEERSKGQGSHQSEGENNRMEEEYPRSAHNKKEKTTNRPNPRRRRESKERAAAQH